MELSGNTNANNLGLAGLGSYARQVAKGTMLFDQDEPGQTMYFVVEGRVRISKIVGKRIQPIAVIEKGDFFGEMSLLSKEPRSARAEAIADSTLIELDNSTFREFLKTNHEAAIRMLFTLVKRLQQTDKLIESLMFDDPQLKVAATLLKLTMGVEREPLGIPILVDVHQLMISSGTDTKVLRMILKSFRDAGFLHIQDGGMFIRDRLRLQQYHNFLSMKSDYLSPETKG